MPATTVATPSTATTATNATAPEPLPASTRAADLFALAYALAFGDTQEQAEDKLHSNDQALYRGWRNLTDIAELGWTRADQGQPPSPLDIAYAQNEFTIHLLSHPTLDDTAARSLAHYYLFQRPVAIIEAPALASLYQSVLQRGLHWISLDAVRARQMSPSQILHAVCRYREQPVAVDSLLYQRLTNYRDVIADEAALIYFNAQPGCAMQPDCDAIARNAPIHAIRAQFATALIDEWQDAGVGIALLPSAPIAPVYAKFWYDGFSLQNARDKNLQALIAEIFDGAPYEKEAPIVQRLIDHASQLGHLPGYPGKAIIDAARRDTLIRAMHADMSALTRYEERPGTVDFAGIWLTRNETAAVVAKRMHDLMLGTHYPKCTVLDAVETTVLRLGPLHDIAFDAYDLPAVLVKAYNDLGRAWDRDPRFAIAPSPYAGQYLTQCRNVLYLVEDPRLTRDRQIALQVAKRLFPALQSAMESAPPQLLRAELEFWGTAIAQFAGMQFVRPETQAARYLMPARQALFPGVRAGVRMRKNAMETIRFGNWTDRQRQLHDYVEEELLALAPLPTYDEDFQIDRILRQQLNMSDADIKTPRPVQFALQSVVGKRTKIPVKNLTPPEEFGMRIRNSVPSMTFGPLTINTVEELESARKRAVTSLAEDQVVRAKSTEIMRRHDIPRYPKNAQDIRLSLASSLVGIATTSSLLDGLLADLDRLFGSSTLRAIIDALASGEPRRIFSLLPFVVPVYDVVKGIEHRNWTLVRKGAEAFGMDLALTALGLGAEKIMLAQLARDADAVLALRRTKPAVVETPLVAETAFNTADDIAAHEPAAQTLPKAAEAAALIPDRRVHLTLYLIDEKRWVAVKPADGAFAETDLRGNVLPAAPVIFGDLASRRGYRLMRRPDMLAAAAVAMPDLTQSATVVDVLATCRRMSRLPNIRARRPNPQKIIRALFSLADNAPSENLRQGLRRIYTRYRTYAQFEQFWEQVYQRSDTAVEFLNAAYDRLPFTGNAEISFHAEQARAIGRDVHLLGESALADVYYVSLNGATRFQWPRMLIHEVLHALGETADTTVFNARGQTTFRTDRILFEMGYAEPIPARLAYQMPPVFSHNEAAHQLWAMHLFDTYDTVVAEDLLLDRILTADRTFPASAMVLGQKVSERSTVRQALALTEIMRTIPKFGFGDVERLFQLTAASFDSSMHSDFMKMLRTLIHGSKTLRELAHAWVRKNTYARARVRTIDFELREGTHFGPVTAHAISGKRIWINTEPLYYFSEQGFAPMDFSRRCTGVIVDYFLGEIMPQIHAITWPDRFRSRGLGVLLENEILQEIGHSPPSRICLELSPNAKGRHRHLTTVRRAGDTERGFLWQTVRERLAAEGKTAGNDLLALTEPAPR